MTLHLGGDNTQLRDAKVDNVAGQNIYHGLSGEHLQELMRQNTEFYMTLVSSYEQLYKEVGQQIQTVRKEHEMQMRDLQIELGIYREGERNQREARQQQIDQRDRKVSRRLFWLLVSFFLLALFQAAALVYFLRVS